jgi:predicted ATP-dependent serine protease
MESNKLQNLSNAIDTAFNTEPIKEKMIWLTDENRHVTETEFLESKREIIEQHKIKRSKYRIDVKEVIPKPQIAISLANTKTDGYAILGTLGNFSVIIGKAKAKKSFFINIAVSTALSNNLILERFKSDLPNDKSEVLYFDTEQGKYHVQKAVRRICAQINQPEPKNLHTYYLRSLTPSERLEFIENEIYSNDKIGFVVIDGIKDLVTSINDEEQATNIASKLLKWTEERNIHIVTVLHQNKSDTNARGHIGTELINKAETVLEVAKSETDNNISIVTPQQCRNIEPEVFAFEINEYGIPIIAENFEIRTETKKNKFNVTDLEDFKKYQLLTDVFSKGESFSYGKLVLQLQFAYKKQFNTDLADLKAKRLLTDCSNNDWLLQSKLKAPYTLGAFKVEN